MKDQQTFLCIGGSADGDVIALHPASPYNHRRGKRDADGCITTEEYRRETFLTGSDSIQILILEGITTHDAFIRLLENYRPKGDK